MTKKNIDRMPEGEPIVGTYMPEGDPIIKTSGHKPNKTIEYLMDDLNDMGKFSWETFNKAMAVNDDMMDIRYRVTIKDIHPHDMGHTSIHTCYTFYQVVQLLAWYMAYQGNRIEHVTIDRYVEKVKEV